MAIYDYLPEFNYIEPNNLKGLQPGFVVAQLDRIDKGLWSEDENGFNNKKVFENGVICTVSNGEDAEGNTFAYVAVPSSENDDRALFIHFSEPLNTVFNSDKYFAVKVEEIKTEEGSDPTYVLASEECPRLVQLMPGDEWMSKKPVGDFGGRIVEIKHKKGWYSVGMPNGEDGYHYMFLG